MQFFIIYSEARICMSIYSSMVKVNVGIQYIQLYKICNRGIFNAGTTRRVTIIDFRLLPAKVKKVTDTSRRNY